MTGKRMVRFGAVALMATTILGLAAGPALACGGLVGENGTIKLVRTTTLAAYHDGVERYVTSFQFAGQGKEVGSIVPLPAIPTKVERGGSWTLQRLEREVAPIEPNEFFRASAGKAALDSAQVILQTKIDALDITILKGGGKAVGEWAVSHGFLLTPDAPEVLDYYAARSPIFMAARFDAQRAEQLGQNNGDGTPIMLTIPTKEPWVPLRILGLGLAKATPVDADVFLLTDAKPKLLAGGRGLALDRDEQAPAPLLDDLRIDKHMGWVPTHMWFTYLRLHANAGDLKYDLAIAATPGALPSLKAAGVDAAHAQIINAKVDHAWVAWMVALSVGALVFLGLTVISSRRRSDPTLAVHP
jgi:hypothetical protein